MEKFSQAEKDCSWVYKTISGFSIVGEFFFFGSRVCLELVYVMLVSGCIVS